MSAKIVLVSNDAEFFNYMSPKLALRKFDSLYKLSFNDIPDKLEFLKNSLVIINSENHNVETIDLLMLIRGIPSYVFCLNEDDSIKTQWYKAGMMNYITPLTDTEELEAKLIPGLNMLSVLNKKNLYRSILVKNNVLDKNNEVYVDYINTLDKEIENLRNKNNNNVLMAISPNDKTKFLISQNQIETIILSNVRQNDILMNFAPNKYFLLLFDTDINNAKKIWNKIKSLISENIYAGFADIGLKKREQVVNEVLNKLHEAINAESLISTFSEISNNSSANFKMKREEFNKKIEKIVLPVFYHIQQKYNDRLYGMSIEQNFDDGNGYISLKSKNMKGIFKITAPGTSKINIDISYQIENQITGRQNIQPVNRITIKPCDFERGFLEDLLEQFVNEFKKEVENGYS